MHDCLTFWRESFTFRLPTVLCLAALLLFVSESLNAQEFRIESQVYGADSNLPVSQNVTLFSQGLVYDFQMSNDAQPRPLEVVVYDSRTRMIVLMDPQRQVRTELPDLRLFKLVDGVRRETLQDERSSFLVTDEFEEEVDYSTNWLTLRSPQIVYRFNGERPANAALLPVYLEFLDTFTLLMATDPTKIPPFARMKLNQSIRRLGWMPSEVQISVKQNSLFRKAFVAKSKHNLIDQLSNKDRGRIATAKQNWMQYKQVELAEYRRLDPNAKPSAEPVIKTASHEESIVDDEK